MVVVIKQKSVLSECYTIVSVLVAHLQCFQKERDKLRKRVIVVMPKRTNVRKEQWPKLENDS